MTDANRPPTDAPAPERETEAGTALAPLIDATAPLLSVAAPLVRTARHRLGQARHRLGQARRRWRQRPAARRRRLRRIAREPLSNLFELYPEALRAAPRELGLHTLDLTDIRGTAVEGHAQRGRDFLPLPPFRSANWHARWQRIRAAVRRLESLPPIDVVRWRDGYWVLDGHNRVAAALYEGQVAIDAVVVEYVMPGAAAHATSREIAPVLEESLALRAAGQRPAARDDTPAGAAAPGPDPAAEGGAEPDGASPHAAASPALRPAAESADDRGGAEAADR